MNKIEITVLSARVLDALSGRGLKAKTVHEFERYGTRRIVKHCLGKGQILYSKETVQNFVWQERAKQESGTLPHYQWGITRRAAVYLDQMAEYGKIQDEPIRPWEAEHNPLFQAISCNPSNSMKVIDIICRTRDAVMQLELSDKTKTNYIYADTEMKRKAIQQAANKLNDTIPDALWNTDDEEMMLKLRGKQQYK